MRSSGITSTPNPRVRIVVALQKYYKGLYGDLSDSHLGVKNSNKDTSEFLTLSHCLNLWCFLVYLRKKWNKGFACICAGTAHQPGRTRTLDRLNLHTSPYISVAQQRFSLVGLGYSCTCGTHPRGGTPANFG